MSEVRPAPEPTTMVAAVDDPSLPASARKPSSSGRAAPRQSARKTGDERWLELLEVSAAMFAKHGYAATSLQQIADELGILKGSIYYYINSKDDLLYEVIRNVYWEGIVNYRRLSSGEGRGIDLLGASVEGHVVYLIEHMAATTVFLREFEQLPPARHKELSGLDYAELVRGLILRGQQDGSIRTDIDIPMTSMAILGAVNWIYRWYRQPSTRAQRSSQPREVGQEFARLFVASLATNR
jgi:AcrR family transcriptional regulator